MIKFESKYILYADGLKLEEDAASISLTQENLNIFPKKSQPIMLPWAQVAHISFRDYKATFYLLSKRLIEFKDLGYKFEDFARISSTFRNEKLIKLYLAEENLKKSMIESTVSYFNGEKNIFKELAEIRIYDTSLIILPDTNEFIRIPFRFIQDINEREYLLEVITERGEKFEISDLGKNFDFFKESLKSQIDETDLMVQKVISDFMPTVDAISIRATVKKLKEGKIMPISLIEKLLPNFEKELEKRILSNDADKKEYQFLMSLSKKSETSFGIKKGLMGQITGDYFIFLFFIELEKNKWIAIFESFSTEGKIEGETDKRATYFYRANEPQEFLNFFNIAMTAINFRRLPILISDERLNEPKYSEYRIAIDRIKELKKLRELYIGRVIHGDFKLWSENIKEIIKFAGKNNRDRWNKICYNEEESEEG